MGKDTLHRDFIKGMRYSQIARLDPDIIRRFDMETLKMAAERLARRGNKQLKAFKDAEVKTPASSWAERNGGAFSVKGKTYNQLSAEFKRAKDFLFAETSSIRGHERVRKRVVKALKKENIEITPQMYEKFWDAYEKLKERDPGVAEKGLKYKVLREIAYMVQSDRRLSAKTVGSRIEKRLEEIYEQDEYGDFYSLSKFFRRPDDGDDDDDLPY